MSIKDLQKNNTCVEKVEKQLKGAGISIVGESDKALIKSKNFSYVFSSSSKKDKLIIVE